MYRWLVFLAAVHATAARAEEPPPTPAPKPVPAPTPEADWEAAPAPDQANGIATDEPTSLGERALWIPRTLFFIPRWVLWSAGQPVRGGAWAYEHYELEKWWYRVFFNAEQTFGIYPTINYDSTFGFSAGARLIDRDLFGEGEYLKLRVNAGGRAKQAYGIAFNTGDRIPHVVFDLDTSYERRPDEPFYGIGNDADTEMRLQENLFRGVVGAQVPLAGPLSFRVANAIAIREIMGIDVNNDRVEGALIYDSRRPTSIYASPLLDATGWFASVYGGVTRGFSDDPSNFTSYGAEVQRFFDLYHGSRVFALRVLVEAVNGGPVSFVDLPRLGGPEFLRGYPSGRFRDHALTLATAEYTWELHNYFAAYTFVDAGRVWPSLSDFDFADPRVGFGIGVEWHTQHTFMGRVQLAGSKDGDFLVDLVVAPAFPRRERIGRY